MHSEGKKSIYLVFLQWMCACMPCIYLPFFFLSPCSYLRKKTSNYRPLNPGAKVPKAVTREWVQVGAISLPCTQTLSFFFVIILFFLGCLS